MARVYDAYVFAFDRQPAHYWQTTADAVFASPEPRVLSTDTVCDVAIIGGGYAGLSAAYRLSSRHHLDVCVLDAGASTGWGASGMNGGFVSMGGAHLSANAMAQRVGEDEAGRYWRSQIEAVEDVRAIIADEQVDCGITPEGNLCVAHHPRMAAELTDEANALSRRFGVAAEFVEARRFRQEVHDGPETFGALIVKPGFGINPMIFARLLAERAKRAGASIFSRAEVVSITKDGPHCRLTTAHGAVVRAAKVFIATNGYMPDTLEPQLAARALPAISSIIVTQPYGERDLDARGFHSSVPIYNARHILSYYRRLPDGRILFGGRGDTSGTRVAANAHDITTLARLKRTLPAFHDARIDQSWRGLVCLTARRTASIGLVPGAPEIGYAFGCHGSGIATMTWAGSLAADLLAGTASESEAVPHLFRGLPPRLPKSASLRRWSLRAAYAGYAIRDALNI